MKRGVGVLKYGHGLVKKGGGSAEVRAQTGEKTLSGDERRRGERKGGRTTDSRL